MRILTALLLLCVALASPASAAPPLNIVLIVSDDQGYRDLGCFGSDEALTPHGNRILIGGETEENAFEGVGVEAGAVAFAADGVF